MHCYSAAAMGAFCLMRTIRNMIYMSINKRMVMACLAVISLGLMKALIANKVVWHCLRATSRPLFSYTPIT